MKELKLSLAKSRFSKEEKEPELSFEEFEKQAIAANDKKIARILIVNELNKRLLKIFDDKTLPQNRGPKEQEAKIKTLTHFVRIAQEINKDPAEINESAGSMVLINGLILVLLKLYDNYLNMEYQVHLLQNEKNSK